MYGGSQQHVSLATGKDVHTARVKARTSCVATHFSDRERSSDKPLRACVVLVCFWKTRLRRKAYARCSCCRERAGHCVGPCQVVRVQPRLPDTGPLCPTQGAGRKAARNLEALLKAALNYFGGFAASTESCATCKTLHLVSTNDDIPPHPPEEDSPHYAA
jgi:hypothetical protein